MSSRVQVEIEAHIATIRLDGPERHNVLDVDGWHALEEAMNTISKRDEVRSVVLRGTGGQAFSAGSDITCFEEQRNTPEQVRAYSDAISSALRAIRGCRHPTIAAIEGLCVGGGLEIASCCDLRVCGESSRFGAPINRLGLTMSYDELEPLVQLLGPGSVMDLLLSGDLIDANSARVVGLVNRVHPDPTVIEHTYELANSIAAGAPLVNRWHKKFIRRMQEHRAVSSEEKEEVHAAFETDDYREGRTAFLEKRSPNFHGS